VIAIIFTFTSFSLAILGGDRSASVVRELAPASAPAAPPTAPTPPAAPPLAPTPPVAPSK
jgi:hypothetical protein